MYDIGKVMSPDIGEVMSPDIGDTVVRRRLVA